MTGFDFSTHRRANDVRRGLAAGERAEAWQHLGIILAALEREPTKAFALTEGAEPAVHDLMLDTATVLSYSRAVAPGHVLGHDPFAWGTAAFAQALANTAEAFASEGLPAPAVDAVGTLKAAMCFLEFLPVRA